MRDEWYPSCVVKLTMRFDEALQLADTGDTVSSLQADAANPTSRVTGGVTVDTAGGVRGLDNNKTRPRRALTRAAQQARQINQRLSTSDVIATPDGVTTRAGSQYAASGINQVNSGLGELPLAAGSLVSPLTFGTDGFTVIANRVPVKGSFKLPHPRSAATFSLTFDYAEFPIDARILRAVGVEIHLGAISAEDYAAGMGGKTDAEGRPLSVLKTTGTLVDPFSGRRVSNGQTLLFYATVDTWETEHTENGSSIRLDGRDVRGIFLDAKIAPAKIAKIDLTQPITTVVENIITTMGLDNDLRMVVMTDVSEWPNGEIPSPGDVNGLTRVRVKAAGAAAGAGATGTPANGTKASYWDLITNYCTIVGAMPVLQGSALWIRPIHSIFDIADPTKKIATPFADGATREASLGGEQFRIRRLVYGRDLKRLKFSRKFAGAVVPTVRCYSFDDTVTGKQRFIEGQWPPKESDQAQIKGESDVLPFPLWGIRSVDSLTQAARGIYEEIGRGETGGTADTENLASFGGSNMDPDVLRAKPMEPIEFLIDARALKSQAPLVSELNDSERRTFSEEVDLLHRRIGDRLVARALVAMARGAIRELLAYYQVIEVAHEWDSSTGVRTQFSFQNYIVPRNRVSNDPTNIQRPPQIEGKTIRLPGAFRKAIALSQALALQALAKAGKLPTTPKFDPTKRPRNLKPDGGR